MADKKDHGDPSHSTSALQRFFSDEDRVPEEFLPENSSKKKKKYAQQFYERLCYAVLVESIHVKERFIQFLKWKQKELEAETLLHQKPLDIKAIIESAFPTTPLKSLLITTTLQEQKQKLQEIEIKLSNIISYLEKKTHQYDKLISQKQDKITKLEPKLTNLRDQLIQQWKNHFNRLAQDPELTLVLNLELSDDFQILPRAEKYSGSIEINRNIYKELENEIDTAISQSKKNIGEIHQHIKQIFESRLKEDLHMALDFIPMPDREIFIDAQMETPELKAFLSKYLWHDMIYDPKFMDQLREAYALEREFIQESVLLAAYKNYQTKFNQLKTHLEDQTKTQLDTTNEKVLTAKDYQPEAEKQLNSINAEIDFSYNQAAIYEEELARELQAYYDADNEYTELMREFESIELQGQAKRKEGFTDEEQKSLMITIEGIHQQGDTSFETAAVKPTETVTSTQEPSQQTEEGIRPNVTSRG